MAMPQSNVVISDKMQQQQFQTNVGNGEIYQRQWLMDERDRFASWIRGEFAASNAIIDCLCNHLRAIGEPGEYDVLMGCVQQRRVTWNHILHMQQFFSIAEITHALQQIAWKKQQQKHFDYSNNININNKVKYSEKEFKRSGSQGVSTTRQWFRVENKENQNSVAENQSGRDVVVSNVDSKNGLENVKCSKEDVKKAEDGKSDENNSALAEEKEVVGTANSDVDVSSKSNAEAEPTKDSTKNVKGSCNDLPKIGLNSVKKEEEEQSSVPIPKTFVGTEIVDGKTVNVVEGLKLYGELFDSSKISSIVHLTNELRSAGRRGQLKGHTFMASKRPMKGRGREVIQLGAPVADAAHEDERFPRNYEDAKVEAMPSLLEDVIDRLVGSQVVPVKPDSCVIDFFNEMDHSQPHVCPHSFGRPVCVLFLTECDITFGKVIGAAHSGEYRGAVKLSMSPGSVLSMQGNSSDIARHAIPSIRKQRIFITFTVSQTKKISQPDGQFFAPSYPAHPKPWPTHQTGHPRGGPKHFVPAATTGVLPIPHLPPPNTMQPIFIPSPVPPPAMSYPTQVPRHPPPRLPLPGTGVFLPPGSGQSPPSVAETPSSVKPNCNGNGNGNGNENTNALPKKSEPNSNGAIASENSKPVGNGHS